MVKNKYNFSLESHSKFEDLDYQGINQRYLSDYGHLLSLGEKVVRGSKYDRKNLAMAVYAWMPTQLKTIDEIMLLEIMKQNSNLNSKECCFSSKRGVKGPVNNSWIGTSKFLHFCYPEKFPIWDSVIARELIMKNNSINSLTLYRSYFKFIHHELSNSNANKIVKTIRKLLPDYEEKMSNVRCLEIAIFTRGKLSK